MFKRFRKRLERKMNSRYRKYVPKHVRKLAEARGVPKPNRWIPSAKGRRIPLRRR
jgi:predicted metal-dependent hydrolase